MPKTSSVTVKPKIIPIIILIFILVFLAVLSINLIPKFDAYQSRLNRNIQYYKQVEYPPLLQIDFDPYLDKVLFEITKENFDLYSSSNSSEIHSLVEKNSLFSEIIGDKKFGSYYFLFKYLAAVVEKDFEIDLINSIKDDGYAEGNIIDYLYLYYISVLEEYLDQSEYDRLSEFSDRAFVAFRQLDLDKDSEITNNYLLNQIILSKALFDYPDLVASNKQSFEILHDILIHGFPDKKRVLLENVSEIGEVKYLKKYWDCVYDFQDRKFIEVQSKFGEIADNSRNFALHNTARLMEARCVFWEAYKQRNSIDSLTAETVSIELDSISKRIPNVESYKSDVEDYKSEVKSWPIMNKLYNDEEYY